MKHLVLVASVTFLIAIGYVLVQVENVTEYKSDEVQEEVIVNPEPEYPVEWLEEAEAAREAVIQKRKLEAERDELIESRAEIQERINEIEKELGVF